MEVASLQCKFQLVYALFCSCLLSFFYSIPPHFCSFCLSLIAAFSLLFHFFSLVSRFCGSVCLCAARNKTNNQCHHAVIHVSRSQIHPKPHTMCCPVPPNIDDSLSSSDVIVREGSNVSLRCRATGSPTPTVKWKRDSMEKISINKSLVGKSGPNL